MNKTIPWPAGEARRLRSMYRSGARYIAGDSDGLGVAADTLEILLLRIRGAGLTHPIYRIEKGHLVRVPNPVLMRAHLELRDHPAMVRERETRV